MKSFAVLILGMALALITGCAHRVQPAPNPSTDRRMAEGQDNEPRQIQVFFDGTANDWSARTNVRRRFELLASAEDPQYPCLYIEGVGVSTLAGKALGLGMKKRVVEAYTFLARHWSKDRKDTIHVYGFSRGAFQARMLTGLLAHCGLPDATDPAKSEQELQKLAGSVWEYCADHLTDPEEPGDGSRIPLSAWTQRLAENREKTKAQPRHQGWVFNNPTINFLGIWDTVPGLPFTKLKSEGEAVDKSKQRYKVRPYPNIKLIAHALSIDEQRSRFAPLLVGPPIDPASKVHEVWFPGVHSDVGGGYADSNDMAGTTMTWMQEVMILEKASKRKYTFYEDSHGILHHPENALENRITSHPAPRLIPEGAYVHFSAFKRANLERHPEEHNLKPGEFYRPTLHVERKSPPGGTTQPPLTLTLTGSTYNERSAAEVLRKVGLKLYGAEVDSDNRTKGAPLSITQMATNAKAISPLPAADSAATPVPPADRKPNP